MQGPNSWPFESLKLEEAGIGVILEEHIGEHSPRTTCAKNSKETGFWFPLNRRGWGQGEKLRE